MIYFDPKPTIYVPTKQCFLIQTVLWNVMCLLAWAWDEESRCLFPIFCLKSFLRLWTQPGYYRFCVTIRQCVKRMFPPNRLVLEFEGAGTQRKMEKRTFSFLTPVKGAGSVLLLLGAKYLFNFWWMLWSSGAHLGFGVFVSSCHAEFSPVKWQCVNEIRVSERKDRDN